MVKQHLILLHIFRVLFVFFLKDLLTPESYKSLLVLLTPDFESQSRHRQKGQTSNNTSHSDYMQNMCAFMYAFI